MLQIVAIGDATPLSKAEQAELDAAPHGLLHRIEFVDDAVLASFYRGAGAVVSASAAEGFGFSVVEAAACATPVVLSDIPAHRETSSHLTHFFTVGDTAEAARLLEGVAFQSRPGLPSFQAPSFRPWADAAGDLHLLCTTILGS